LVGDVLIQCTGGAQPNPATAQVPGVDITVTYSSPLTSRQASAGTPAVVSSDIALVIDDPNSTSSPLVVGYGPNAPLTACGVIAAAGGGATEAPACPTFDFLSGGYYVSASTAAGGTTAANVYQGIITGGGTAVTFYGVPLVAPVSSGIFRRYRVVNARVASGSSAITATVTTSGPNAAVMGLTGTTTATVGTGQTGFAYSVANSVGAGAAGVVSQCINPTSIGTANPQFSPDVALVSFKENFSNAAKPIGPVVVTGPATPGAPGPPVVPPTAQVYGNYNNESGVILPGLPNSFGTVATTGANSLIPGAADAGTRFKAVFSGVPWVKGNTAQPTIYVSLWNVSSFTADASGAGAGTQVATLNAVGGAPASEFSSFATGAVAGDINVAGNVAVPAVPLVTQSNGTATAVWEVSAVPAGKSPTFTFAVYVAYGTATPTLSNITVTLSAAPVQPATQPTPADAVQIPSFSTSATSSPVLNIVQCQTALLFPFVSTAVVTPKQHWETGIAISNTSSDPWSSVPATNAGTCTVSFYGNGVGGGASTMTPPTITGPSIPIGGNWAFTASDPLQTGTAPNVGFSGYVFAVCNFSYAHGFAFVEDNSPTGNAMGYLALVVNNGVPVTRAVSLNGEALEN
jgi:hypothetical protein